MGWGEMVLERGKMMGGRGEVTAEMMAMGGCDGRFFFSFLTKGAEVSRRERIIHINFVVKAKNEAEGLQARR